MADKFYSETHEWAEMGQDGLIAVGLAAAAWNNAGAVTSATLPEPGRSLARAEPCGEIAAGPTIIALHAPLSGTVAEPNPAILAEPEAAGATPTTTTWLFKMRLTDPSTLAELMDQAAYDAFVTTAPPAPPATSRQPG